MMAAMTRIHLAANQRPQDANCRVAFIRLSSPKSYYLKACLKIFTVQVWQNIPVSVMRACLNIQTLTKLLTKSLVP